MQNDNHFHSKRPPRTILSENSCHFVNLLSFASSSFFLSLRKIMCLNSQQPKTRGHAEHGTLALKYFATVKKFKIQMLYKMYKLDFKMFDYGIQPYLDVGRDWIKKYVHTMFRYSLYFHERNSSIVITGKSFSKVLILASTNPQYDKRLFIDLPVEYMKTTSSKHGVNMCTQIFLLFLFRHSEQFMHTTCSPHVLSF